MFNRCSVTKQIYIVTLMCILWSRLDVGNSKQAGIQVSSRLISSLCALYTTFQDEKIMVEEPLKSMPQGIPVLDATCDTWKRTCVEDCKTWKLKKESKCKYKKERGARIIGGEDAKEADVPWDLHLRYITDWGGASNIENMTKEEIATNNVSRIKENDRCTGIFYTQNWVVTTGTCGHFGKEIAPTANRWVGWLARQKFLVQQWCRFKSKDNKETDCDIIIHPNMSKPNRTTTGYSRSEDDISVMKFYKGFDFKKYQNTKAILFAQPGMEFEGKALFAGWGITNNSFSKPDIINGPANHKTPALPTKLQKIELTIIPFEPQCKQLLFRLFDAGAGVFNPKYDYSQKYMCAEPKNGMKQGICDGDDGGALVCDKDGKKYVCGLKTQWGSKYFCLDDGDGIEIFLKMSYYTPWIESVAGKQSDSDLNPYPTKHG